MCTTLNGGIDNLFKMRYLFFKADQAWAYSVAN